MCILKTFMVICLSFLPVNYSKVYESNCNQNDFVGCKVTRAGASLVTALQSYGILLWETAGLWFMNEDSLKKHQYHPAWTITLMGSHLNSNPMWGRLLAFWNSVVSFLDEGATCVINSCKQVESEMSWRCSCLNLVCCSEQNHSPLALTILTLETWKRSS